MKEDIKEEKKKTILNLSGRVGGIVEGWWVSSDHLCKCSTCSPLFPHQHHNENEDDGGGYHVIINILMNQHLMQPLEIHPIKSNECKQ